MITITAPSRYKLNKKLLKEKAQTYLHGYEVLDSANLNIIFTGKRKMFALSSQYKHEHVALPVLTFPYNPTQTESLLGEIFICYPQAILLAAERQKKVDVMIVKLIEHGIDNLFK
ncbi:rRNA maturation RNAse YbeY [Candidatus Roizmanbacteria bacterium]|nr:rRNA maturation RNAse YbeY [Candidatus Roizmanbacteria bacterium]